MRLNQLTKINKENQTRKRNRIWKRKNIWKRSQNSKSRSGVAVKSFEGGQMPLYRRLPKRVLNLFLKKM